MSVSQEGVAAELAARVRAARTQRRWTLDEFAARSTISRRSLLQIEHGEANPSLATLLKLAASLSITLTELVADEPETAPIAVVEGGDAIMLWSTPAGSVARLLVGHGAIELWSWTLAPGDRRDSDPHRPGSVELINVETGTVALDVGHHQAAIPAGDSAWFDATLPHSYANPDTTTAATFTLVVCEHA